MAALEWIVTMREGLKLSEQFPNDVLHVPYEKLCQDAQPMARQIANFLNLPDDSTYLKYAQEVLASSPAYKPFVLPEVLMKPFEQTQLELERLSEGGS